MIVETMLDLVFKIVEGVLSILPNFTWSVQNSFFSTALDMIRVACYLLPMGTVVSIITIINLLLVIRIAIAIIKTIWDLLPLV